MDPLNASAKDTVKEPITFTPLGFLELQNYKEKKLALILLKNHCQNRCKVESSDLIQSLWQKSNVRAIVNDCKPSCTCCQEFRKSQTFQDTSVDSAQNISQTKESSCNDFYTCVNQIVQKINFRQCNPTEILAISEDTKSVTEILGYIRVMSAAQNTLRSGIPISIYTSQSFISVLPQGTSNLNMKTGFEGKWCGLLPFGGEVVTTTTGLKWNLTNDILQYNQLISTSNELDGSGLVVIQTDRSVVWTQGIQFSS